jgi:hypothetical protein
MNHHIEDLLIISLNEAVVYDIFIIHLFQSCVQIHEVILRELVALATCDHRVVLAETGLSVQKQTYAETGQIIINGAKTILLRILCCY